MASLSFMPVNFLVSKKADTGIVTGSWSGAFRAVSAIYRDTGVRGLFQGHSATLLRIFPYAAINYMAYDQFDPVRSFSLDYLT